LSKGKASGRGLKLDFKDLQDKDMPGLLKTIKEAGVPDHRLMFNLGRGAAEKWGPEIRKQSPNAIIAINPSEPPGNQPVGTAEARQMVETAKKVGGPVSFVVDNTKKQTDFGKVIPEFKKLPGATISVWGTSGDVEGRTQELRERGVNGLIDLKPQSLQERFKDTFGN
jgi:hypothetical protein